MAWCVFWRGTEPHLVTRQSVGHTAACLPGGGVIVSLLKWAFLFLLLAGIAGLLGFSGVAAGAENISKALFMIFLVVFAVIGVLAVTLFKSVT
jgi:uncharacterized membrane protein YtjA (UPF0391 family)